MTINLKKWLIIIINVFILSLGINMFSFENDFVTGGIDGTCIVIGKFIPSLSKTAGYSYNYNLYVMLNLIALIICFFQEKINIFLKTCFIVMLLLINLMFINYLETEYLKNFTSLSDINNSFIKQISIFRDTSINKFFYTSIFSGITFGLTLGSIRKYGYTTGGMDIYQKFLKDKFYFSFTLVLFLTDGIIIFLAFVKDFLNDSIQSHLLMHFTNRIIFPYISLIIIGYIMNRIHKKK